MKELPMKASKTKTPPLFSNELLDQILADNTLGGDWTPIQSRLDALKGALMERMLAGEMTHHLGYNHRDDAPEEIGNRRNGHSPKTLQTDSGSVTIKVPRDRDGAFDPVIVQKYQRRLPDFDEKVIALYARGLSTKDIQSYLYEIYQTEVSAELISIVTEEVMAELTAWQTRPLESHYPILYLDGLRVKIRENGHILAKTVYIAIGVDMEGRKDILGLWVAKTEGSKFWLSVLTDLKNRGVEDVFIACCDGLTGLPDAINAVFPQTTVQLCIVHMIRNSLKFVSWKDYRAITHDLKAVYTAASEAAARKALEAFAQKWNGKYPTIVPMWERHWEQIVPFLAYPPSIRKVIYTTNTIEAVNRQIRKVIKTKGSFPSDDAALKLIYLALKNANISAIMPARDWKLALAQFAILFHHRLPA
jgi:putative transposase